MNKISIVIPAYNEVEGIAETLDQVSRVAASLRYDTEILVVDDGSTDGTSEAIPDSFRVIRHARNKGYGAALKTGLLEAEGDVIVILDADLTYPPERIPEMLDHLEFQDMVVGARTGDTVHIPLVRRPAKWILNQLANRVAGERIPDLNSGLRAFRRDLAMKYFHLFPDGFSFTTTITLASLCDGHRVEFIPIDYTKRSGKSKIRPLRDTFNFIVLIIRVAAYFDPLRVFLPASFFTGFISLTMLVYYFYKDGGVSDAGVLACMVTLLIFMMGILADLVVRRSRS
ncbi:MAG: glycosyltransferase family 2 protein [Candidatus Omnitrophica bacterium]|nr:glycosyltransferase family 2 protein [Candidatus Omnitrophota bacterium]MCA9430108.1 glycosyltransferase family 2 protein [Candidatus Omnitrophota bacterium]MCB9768267.1 glycosyltransferase family 2 protein [Candidatus Omnitrophota bacterium]